MPPLYNHLLGLNKPADMSSFTSSSSTLLYRDFVGDFYTRRLLLNIPLCQPPATATPPASAEFYTGEHSSNEDAVIVISVLICALICSMGLCSVLRCGSIRCPSFVPSAPLANTGIKKKLLKTFPTLTYSDGLDQPGLDTQCVICLSEFKTGECVRVLPKCKHGFHVQCIDMWLDSHSSCPTCRHCLNCTQASSSQPPPQPLQELAIVSITPLQAEGMVHNYWNDQHVINIGIEKMKLATKCGLTS